MNIRQQLYSTLFHIHNNKVVIQKNTGFMKSASSTTSFDLQYPNKISDNYIIRKNDKLKNIYESAYEQVPMMEDYDDDFKQEEQPQVDWKQYVSSVLFPNGNNKLENTLPEITLELEFVNGYNPLEREKEIVFSAAVLGIVMDIQNKKQRFYGVYGEMGHNMNFDKFHRGPIVSLDYNRDKNWVATGSMGLNPQICIWNPTTFELVNKFHQGKKSRSVSLVKFFMSGQYVITLQREEKINHIHLWTINGKKILSQTIDGTVYVITTYLDKFIVTSSKGCCQFFYNKQQNTLSKTKLTDKFTIGAGYLDGSPVFGNSYGILTYKDKQLKIDDECIFCITVYDSKIYTSGSASKKLFVINNKLEIVKSFELAEYARSISVWGEKILVGLRNGVIAEIENEEVNQIMNTHFVGELWGLTYNSQNNTFVTAGEDNKILHFDIQQKKIIKSESVGQSDLQNKLYQKGDLTFFPSSKQSRAITIYQDKMVYTTNYSQLILLFLNSSNTRFTYQMEDRSETLQFSSNGNQLAVGCYDECILLFNITEEKGFQLITTLSGHQSIVNDLDFNLENTYLRSAGVSGELRYWNLETFKQVVISSKNCHQQQKQTIKDATWTGLCRFCWQTTQLFKQTTDHEFFNKIAVSKSEDNLAVGEDDNCLRLYRARANKFRKFRAHASHVINVCWSNDDQYLASIGGPDRCLMIWRVKDAEN